MRIDEVLNKRCVALKDGHQLPLALNIKFSVLVLCLAVTLRMLCALERLRAKKRINGEVRILRQNVERFDEVADDFSRRQMRGRAFAVIFELESVRAPDRSARDPWQIGPRAYGRAYRSKPAVRRASGAPIQSPAPSCPGARLD